jgi:hypothetical protein
LIWKREEELLLPLDMLGVLPSQGTSARRGRTKRRWIDCNGRRGRNKIVATVSSACLLAVEQVPR